MSEEELKKYNAMFTDYWKLLKRYSNPDGSAEYYRLLRDDEQRVHAAYQNVDDRFATDLGVAVITAIQRYDRRVHG